MANPAFPSPATQDPQTVASALEKGQKEWERGQLREAVRWIHRAADAAEAAGDDARALTLARIAADLMSALDLSPAASGDEATAPASFDDFNDQTIVDAPAVTVARQTAQGPVTIGERRASSASKASTRSPAPAQDDAAQALRMRATLRVAVGLTTASPGALNVMVLPEGTQAPAGTTEALLVMLDPDARIPMRP